jgi:hypothetical protein
MAVFVGFSNVIGPKRPMNPVFTKLPRNYAADAAWSRIFFLKKMESGPGGGSRWAWNIEAGINARI